MSQRERTWTLLYAAVGTLGIGAGLMLIAEFFQIGGWYYGISAFLFGGGAFVGQVILFVLLIENVVTFVLESRVTANMVAVDPQDHVFENRKVDDAIVRSPVVGVTTQMITIAADGHNMPFVRRTPIYLTHVASELPAVEDMSTEEYQHIVEMFHGNGHGNGNGKEK
jgi:hypothetical protein